MSIPVRLMPTVAATVIVVAAVIVGAVPADAQSFTRLGLGAGGGTTSSHRISADGKVVVGYRQRATGDTSRRYFWWSEQTGYRTLALPSGFENPTASGSIGVSGDGSVVAGSVHRIEFDVNKSSYELVRWTEAGGGFSQTIIPTPGNSEAFAYDYDVSVDGSTIVGVYDAIPNWEGNTSRFLPARWVNGIGETLDVGSQFYGNALAASANGDIVVGYVGNRAARWTGAGLEVIGPDNTGNITRVRAVAVDASGLIVAVASLLSTNESGSFSATGLWTPDGYVDLPDVPGAPNALSGDGSVIATGTGLWTADGGFQTLRDLLENAGLGEHVAGFADNQIYIRDMAADGRTILGTITQGRTLEPFVAYLGPLVDDIVVNMTGDEPNVSSGNERCDADANEPGDQCTLRAAIETANARAGRDSVSFNIEMPGPHTISFGASSPAITEPILIDASTQPGYNNSPVVTVTGTGNNGFLLEVGESTLRGLAIGGFAGAGVHITGPGGNRVESSHIGVSADGTTPLPNGTGIVIEDSPDNVIGGEPTEETGKQRTAEVLLGNVISGNTGAGVLIHGGASMGNAVEGNRIGTDAAGLAAVPNGGAGVEISAAMENTIGGETDTAGEGAGNLISGNAGAGVVIAGADETAAGKNRVSGNMIGLDGTGDQMLSNEGSGVHVRANAEETIIGGDAESSRNVISGNGDVQIFIEDSEAHAPIASVVAGNYVGTNRTGLALIQNDGFGVIVGGDGFLDETGVPLMEIRNNLISGYPNELVLNGRSSGGANITGNRIGLLADNSVARDEKSGSGIVLLGASRSVIGEAGMGNTLAGLNIGLVIAADSVTVTGNRIGTDPTGTIARPNLVGIEIASGFFQNGTRILDNTGRRNLIGSLDELTPSDATANVISGNLIAGIRIGTEVRFGEGAGRTWKGQDRIALRPSTRTTSLPKQPAMSSSSGFQLAAADSNLVIANYIGVAKGGLGELGNALFAADLSGGVVIKQGRGNRVYGNIIGNNATGILLDGADHPVKGTEIDYNYIGISPRGDVEGTPKPNVSWGIVVLLATETKIGVPIEGQDRAITNVIAHNQGDGAIVYLRSTPSEAQLNTLFYRNQFRDNGLKGIAFVNTQSQGGDDIAGLPASPNLYLATVNSDEESASVYLNSPVTADLEIYISPACDPSGRGEGVFYAQTVATTAGATQRIFFTDPDDRAAAKKNHFLTATATMNGERTSEFSICTRIVDEDETSTEYVEPGQTGIIVAENGIQVEIQSSSVGKGTGESNEGNLFAARLEGAPTRGPFSGAAATSDDGTLVLPTVVSDNRYWTMTSDGLTDVVFKVCVDISDLPNANTPGQLVLAMREHPGMPWTPLTSTLDSVETQLCAEGIESFGEIGIAGDAAVNPVPVEPVAGEDLPTALDLRVYPTPAFNAVTLEVEMPDRETARIEVIDLTGRGVAMVFDGVVQPGVRRFDLPVGGLSAGVYLVRVSGRSFNVTRKLVVAH